MSDWVDTIYGLPHIGPLGENSSQTKATANLVVQRLSYQLSKAIFNFSPPTFDLDKAILKWHSQGSRNFAGRIPDVYPLETRVGASLALLGYLEKTTSAGLTTVVAGSGTLSVMEPVLSRHMEEFKESKVVFQVAAADYDVDKEMLVSDPAPVGRVARNLNLPMISSSLALENDAFNSSVLASIIGLNISPSVHVYDGIRGSRQAFTDAPTLKLPSDLPVASGLLDAFKVTNQLLKTDLAPFEYYGPAEPSTVYISMGLPSVLSQANKESVGTLNVRLYSPFLVDEFLKTIPVSARKLIVVGESADLYKDVSAAIRLHYGFKGGPTVISEQLGTFENSVELKEQGFTAKVWDSDKASTAAVAGKMTALLPEGNCFTRFDNYIAGGIVSSDIRLKFKNHFWDLAEADVALVNYSNILKSVDVTSSVKAKGKLVVAAASDEEVDKLVPGQLKLNAMAKGLEIYRVDYSQINSGGSEGRTTVLAGQAALWLLSGADVDSTTSLVVHANSWDTELVAATVNKIATTLQEGALSKVAEDVLKEWTKVELTDKERDISYATRAFATSFVGTASGVSTAEEDSATPGEFVDITSSLGLKKRLVFPEAFSQTTQLRPDFSSRTFVSKVKLNERVTPANYDRHIFHLELDITGTGLKYAIGEALGVHAPNNAEDVSKFLEWYKINPNDTFGVPLSTVDGDSHAYRTAYQISRDHLDLYGKVPKRFYEALAQYATDEEQKAHLEQLSGSEGAEELKKRSEVEFENYVDVLKEFDSAKPSFAELIDLIAPLKRREYSIASSQKVHPNEVHLLIVVVDWVDKNGEKRYGQCSKFLADLKKGSEVVVSVKPSVMKLPSDPATPVIMAGLGTGLAPFKAFLEEKMWQRDQGHKIGSVFLFLGSRHKRQEYLYGELFEAYKAAGVLTHIGAAFSRDQADKIYIQHRIHQAKNELTEAFVHQNGNFYLCGPTWPVPDISAALTDIVLAGAAQKGESVREATLIEDLKENDRYILEVY